MLGYIYTLNKVKKYHIVTKKKKIFKQVSLGLTETVLWISVYFSSMEEKGRM